jgi:hypothetical protein
MIRPAFTFAACLFIVAACVRLVALAVRDVLESQFPGGAL